MEAAGEMCACAATIFENGPLLPPLNGHVTRLEIMVETTEQYILKND